VLGRNRATRTVILASADFGANVNTGIMTVNSNAKILFIGQCRRTHRLISDKSLTRNRQVLWVKEFDRVIGKHIIALDD
jgi:ribosomal protein L24E